MSPNTGRDRGGWGGNARETRGLRKRLDRVLNCRLRVRCRPVSRFSHSRFRFPCATANMPISLLFRELPRTSPNCLQTPEGHEKRTDRGAERTWPCNLAVTGEFPESTAGCGDKDLSSGAST